MGGAAEGPKDLPQSVGTAAGTPPPGTRTATSPRHRPGRQKARRMLSPGVALSPSTGRCCLPSGASPGAWPNKEMLRKLQGSQGLPVCGKCALVLVHGLATLRRMAGSSCSPQVPHCVCNAQTAGARCPTTQPAIQCQTRKSRAEIFQLRDLRQGFQLPECNQWQVHRLLLAGCVLRGCLRARGRRSCPNCCGL